MLWYQWLSCLVILTPVTVCFKLTKLKFDSADCHQDVEKLLRGIDEFEPWAMQMLDASAKLPSGVLRGNIRALGDYDECVELQGSSPVSPQFCLADIHVHDAAYPRLHELLERATLGRRNREILYNRTGYMVPNYLPTFSHIQMGACVPNSCGPRDTEMLITEVLKHYFSLGKFVSFDIAIDTKKCSDYQRSSNSLWIILSIFGIIIAMSLIGTIHGLLAPYRNKDDHRWFRAFNFASNWSSIRRAGSLKYLEGMRGLSAVGIVAEHQVLLHIITPYNNMSKLLNYIQNPFLLQLTNIQTTDNFFVFSGFLRALQLFNDLDRNGKFTVKSLTTQALRRYFRLTITQVIVIMFYTSVLPSLGSGPQWYEYLELPSLACRRNWHYNLLCILNYGPNQSCVAHTWYGSADFQLFLSAPIFVWLLQKYGRIATFTIILMIAIPTLELFFYILATRNVALVTLGASDEGLMQYLTRIYLVTHHRCAAYFVGIGLGHMVHKINTSKLQVTQNFLRFGWSFVIVLASLVILSSYSLKQFNYEYKPLEMALYGALNRPLWALVVAWVVFSCHQHQNGILNRFLSSPYLVPLGRLSYCLNLTHPIFLLVQIATTISSVPFGLYSSIRVPLGDLVFMLFVASMLYVFVEAPSERLMKLVFSNNDDKTGTEIKQDGKVKKQ